MKNHPALILFLFFTFLVFLDTFFIEEIFNFSMVFIASFKLIYLFIIGIFIALAAFTSNLLFEYIKKVDSLRRSIKKEA
jgi:uncharacterized membrane protein YozB (DUF420 family)